MRRTGETERARECALVRDCGAESARSREPCLLWGGCSACAASPRTESEERLEMECVALLDMGWEESRAD